MYFGMKKELVYDLPTRIFHWLFSGCFVSAFLIAKTQDDESLIFSYHMLFGLTLGFLVMLRIVWGVVGTHHARFNSFALRPKDLTSYFKGILLGDTRRWSGHNPASSWAALAMLVLGLGSAVTGTLMASGFEKENLEDIHEVCANSFVIVALAHVAGIVLHTLRLKDWIGLSMLSGRKSAVKPSEVIPSPKTATGLIFLAVTLGFFTYLVSRYDSQKRSLDFFGTTLSLGEEREAEGED